MWCLKNAKQAANISWLRELAASGKKVMALETMPTLLMESRAYWDAYSLLSERRTWTSDGNRRLPDFIPISEIEAYCRFTERFDQDDQRDLLYYCSILDRAYRDYLKSKPMPSQGKQGRTSRK